MKKSIAAIAVFFSVGVWAADEQPVQTPPVEETVKQCAACHGEDGNKPVTPDTPKLGGQHADYLAKALRDYKDGARKNPIMGAMAAALTEQQMKELAAYFSRQKSDLFVKY
jgi:cytochrome c553